MCAHDAAEAFGLLMVPPGFGDGGPRRGRRLSVVFSGMKVYVMALLFAAAVACFVWLALIADHDVTVGDPGVLLPLGLAFGFGALLAERVKAA